MAKNEPSLSVQQFLGLRNTDRPARLPPGALVVARNIDVDDTSGIERRRGYTILSGLTSVTAAYNTVDERFLYVVDSGMLKIVLSLSPLVTEVLATGVPSGEVWWAEGGGHVFCSGAINGVIRGNQFWTFENFGSADELTVDAQGQTLATDEADVGTSAPPINTECVTFYQGSVWLSYYDTVSDQSFAFRSKPFFWSRWDLARDYIPVSGRIVMMGATETAVVIGTDSEIWVYGQDVLQCVAPYGAVPCQTAEEDKRLYFWTQRGLCRAFPFEPMTEEAVSLPPGTRARLVVHRDRGCKRAIVVTTGGGEADNSYE
tara:strand:+ start:39513 stop:40460 length:948 start_codon:yes stop_codon:yes gene_type:complete